jgi:hypothetical protein
MQIETLLMINLGQLGEEDLYEEAAGIAMPGITI